jgi:predicted dehydrogenase
LYHTQPEARKGAPKVVAAMNKYYTGVDDNTTIVCQFPNNTMGIATTNLHVSGNPDGQYTAGPTIRTQGTEGEIQVMGPGRPLQYNVTYKKNPGKLEVVDCPIEGHFGMAWEADECARCLRDGKKESATLPLAESITIMETMEEALKQGCITYPDLITTDVYDPQSPLSTGNQ